MREQILAGVAGAPWAWKLQHIPESPMVGEHWTFRVRVPQMFSAHCMLHITSENVIMVADSRHVPRHTVGLLPKLEYASMCTVGKFVVASERHCICWLGMLPFEPSVLRNLEASTRAFVGASVLDLQNADSILRRIVEDDSFLSGMAGVFTEAPAGLS